MLGDLRSAGRGPPREGVLEAPPSHLGMYYFFRGRYWLDGLPERSLVLIQLGMCGIIELMLPLSP